MLPPWYEVGEAVAAVVLGILVLLWLWLRVDCRTASAAWLRHACRRPGARNLLWLLAGLCILFIAAEDVLDVGSEEALPELDTLARDTGRFLGTSPLIHALAWRLSDIAGTGLATAIVGVALCLLVLRHRREALTIVAGAASAWALSGILKLAFGVPRPSSSYSGFPSGHVMVTLVGVGLTAWCLGRLTDAATRRALYAAAVAATILTGASRIILDAHWLSDVIGGLAAGIVWLNIVIFVAVRSPRVETAPPALDREVPAKDHVSVELR